MDRRSEWRHNWSADDEHREKDERAAGHLLDLSHRVHCGYGIDEYLRGDIDAQNLIAGIKPAKGQVVVPELCVAYFVIGEKHLLDGDRARAREYFQKAIDTRAATLAEWIVANARLKELGAKPKETGRVQ